MIINRAREAPFEKRLVAKVGLRSLKLTLRHDAGWPDRLWLIPGGRPAFTELKAPGKTPTPLQLERIIELRRLGYSADWFDDYDAAIAWLYGRVGR